MSETWFECGRKSFSLLTFHFENGYETFLVEHYFENCTREMDSKPKAGITSTKKKCNIVGYK